MTDVTDSKSVTSVCPYLSLLADDGDSVLQLDIMEKALEKNVGHPNQVVVLLRLVERITVLTACFVILYKGKQKNILLITFPLPYSFFPISGPLLLTVSSVPSFQSL